MSNQGRLCGALLALATLAAFLPLCAQIAFSGTPRHVVVSGGVAAGNAQDSAHGWTLAWAISTSNSTRVSGDTMYLHAGTYLGRNQVDVSGTPGSPLIYRNWNGQRVQLFDNNSDLNAVWCPWQPTGSYVWLWGVELAHGNPANGGDADLISIQGSYDKIINCTIHDALSLGIDDFATGAAGTEIVGNVFYYNGRGPIHWNGSPYKSQPGYAAYVQNKVTSVQKLYRYNIVGCQWDCGMQFYGSNETQMSNIKVYHNVYFNNGNLWSESGTTSADERYKPNFYFGPGETGGGPMDNDTVRGNISWYSVHPARGNNVFLGYNGDGYTNFAVDSNYFVSPNAGGSYTSVAFSKGINASDGLTSFKGNVLVGSYSGGSLSSVWPTGNYGNQYYPSGSFPARATEIRIEPNPYEAKRANITILNWGGAATVNVDLSPVLKAGDVYHIKSATDFYGPDIAGGTYNGGLVAIDANSPTMAATVGGYQPFQPVNPAPYFLSLVLLGPNVSTVLNSPPLSPPAAVTTAASNITSTGARLNGTVNPNGTGTTYHFEYGSTTSYGSSTSSASAGSGSSAVNVSATLSNLSTNSVFHFRLVAANGGGTSNGNDVTLTIGTPPVPLPVVVTGAASSITTTGARLNGTVNPGGSGTTYHFEYGSTTSYGSSTPSASAGSTSSAVSVNATLSNLSTNSVYHFRLVATNSGGTSNGNDATVTIGTPPGPLPVVVTAAASNITSTGARVNGSVNPNGASTTYYFMFGQTSAYGSSTPVASAGSGSGAVSVSAALTGLTPGTVYYYQLVAVSNAGTISGNDSSFVTESSSGSGSADTYDLWQNYPNPFNPSTSIVYVLRKAADVSLRIFNTLGVEVASLASGFQAAGRHVAHWDATGLASGIYFDTMVVDGVISTRRMILIK